MTEPRGDETHAVGFYTVVDASVEVDQRRRRLADVWPADADVWDVLARCEWGGVTAEQPASPLKRCFVTWTSHPCHKILKEENDLLSLPIIRIYAKFHKNRKRVI